jgi:tetratricopeptide (TPR) repeat protein
LVGVWIVFLFWFWLAMTGSLAYIKKELAVASGTKNTASTIRPDSVVSTGSVVTTGLVFALLIFVFNIQPARANMKTLEALKYLSYQPDAGIDLMKSALAFNSPHIDDIRSDLARTVAQVLTGDTSKIGKEKSLEMFSIASDALKANIELHPYDIRNYLTLSQLSQSGYGLTGDVKYIGDYGTYLQTALSYSPKRQQIIYNIANFNLQIGKMDEAVKLIEGTITDDPKVTEGYWRLAYLYKLTGKTDKAKEALDLAAKNGAVFNQKEQEIIAEILKIAPAKK